jgi:1-acyl-sn-glycerol-3-phosphate acyltransferase
LRSLVSFLLLSCFHGLSRIFYRHEVSWVDGSPTEPWTLCDRIRVVAILNHTSLYEVLFAGAVPLRFHLRAARHGVVAVAEKTLKRPLVGKLFRFIAAHVVSVTRERDHTWQAVLKRIGPESMVLILPEGRMMRANGLDANGQPMTRDGFAFRLAEHVKTAATKQPSILGKRVTPHVLRHSCAMHTLAATGDIRKVALWLGHASIQSTETYLRADPEEKLQILAAHGAPAIKPGRFKPPSDALITMLTDVRRRA